MQCWRRGQAAASDVVLLKTGVRGGKAGKAASAVRPAALKGGRKYDIYEEQPPPPLMMIFRGPDDSEMRTEIQPPSVPTRPQSPCVRAQLLGPLGGVLSRHQ